MSVRIEIVDHGVWSAEAGGRLLDLFEAQGVPIEAACGGFACCNTCRVEVVDGADGLSGRLPEEDPFLDHPAQRLACQAWITGSVVVRLAPGG